VSTSSHRRHLHLYPKAGDGCRAVGPFCAYGVQGCPRVGVNPGTLRSGPRRRFVVGNAILTSDPTMSLSPTNAHYPCWICADR